MNVVASAFIYNPELAAGQLAAQGASPAIFSTWCGMIATKKRNGELKHFRRMYDKKVCGAHPKGAARPAPEAPCPYSPQFYNAHRTPQDLPDFSHKFFNCTVKLWRGGCPVHLFPRPPQSNHIYTGASAGPGPHIYTGIHVYIYLYMYLFYYQYQQYQKTNKKHLHH